MLQSLNLRATLLSLVFLGVILSAVPQVDASEWPGYAQSALADITSVVRSYVPTAR